MEDETKIGLSIAAGILSLIVLLIISFSQHTPNVVATVDYPSLIFKPSIFEIQFSLKNTQSGSIVKNDIIIDSKEIQQMDVIPTDCEELTKEERICEESLSFKVINSTKVGSHIITFVINSTSPINLPIVKNYLDISSGSTIIEIPINIDNPEITRMSIQSSISHQKSSLGYKFFMPLLISLVISLGVLFMLFIPEKVWDMFF